MKGIIALLVGLLLAGVLAASAGAEIYWDLSETLRATEEQARSPYLEKILEAIGEHFTYEEGRQIEKQFRMLEENAVASAKKAREVFGRGDRKTTSQHITEAQKYIRMRLNLEKLITRSLVENQKEAVKEIKKFLEKGKTPI